MLKEPKLMAKVFAMKNISVNDAAQELATLLDKYDWFSDIIVINNKLEVIVNKMNKDVFEIVPSVLYGFTVGLSYISYLNYTTVITLEDLIDKDP